MGDKAFNERFARWDTCSLCEQEYHGVVLCALGWGCWKTYVGRAETDVPRQLAMSVLGLGLYNAQHHEDALIVQEAEFSMLRRLGVPVDAILCAQNNLATTYEQVGRREEALRMRRDTYSGRMKLNGEEDETTLIAANNYADTLLKLDRFEEAKALLRKIRPVAKRALGEGHVITLRMALNYARGLYEDGATLDDLREAVTLLEDLERTTRRVLGASHPLTRSIECDVRDARAALRARETPSGSSEEILQTADDIAAHFG